MLEMEAFVLFVESRDLLRQNTDMVHSKPTRVDGGSIHSQ